MGVPDGAYGQGGAPRVPVRHQMARNENFYPPLPGVVEAILESAEGINRNPDVFATGLSAQIADLLGVPSAHVLAGAGSAALLHQLMSHCAGPETDVVHAWPSFEAYPVIAGNVGANPVRVPLREYTHDLDAMADAVTDRTRVVVVCNPNNPTGCVLGESELRRFLKRLPHHVTVIVDEAYREFAVSAGIADGINLYRDDERVCVIRTFSKAYGLLGLRVGFMVA
ncbi:MAG: aminotransferase class I/II-fold pyridoxal phosphate-dependent enzyme, partial [Kutzneria sp.]|nr:aminotransferase class I/II-fold pyridoxal phosphate-dependent enzyme [Kutzneria sp.]